MIVSSPLDGSNFEFPKEFESKETESEDVVLLHLIQLLNKHCILQLQFLPEDPPHLVDQAEVRKISSILGGFLGWERMIVGREKLMVIAKEVLVDCIQATTSCTVCTSLNQDFYLVINRC